MIGNRRVERSGAEEASYIKHQGDGEREKQPDTIRYKVCRRVCSTCQLKILTFCHCRCSEFEKFLYTFVIIKLKLVRGKIILFVSDIDRCYKLKLFLEQFSIKACVLNSELPLNSR